MSYTAAADGPPAPSSLDGQPLDDDAGACVAYSSSTAKHSSRDKYKRHSRRSRSTDRHGTDSRSPARSCDYYTEKRRRGERSRHRRSRSTSRRRHYERKRRRRKPRHTKSRSRSRSRRSRSRSRDHYSRCRRSRSRCCRYNGSCSCSSASSTYSDRDTSSLYRSHARKYVREVPKDQEYIRKVYAKLDDADDDDAPVQENSFKNDGSFLEMFKKMQEDKAAEEKRDDPTPAGAGEVKRSIPIVGKRRGGRVLKTGLVQKLKSAAEVDEEPKDAWSVYMKEVKRYKEACCDDDSKTRPLVK